jgi:hypothetical protein
MLVELARLRGDSTAPGLDSQWLVLPMSTYPNPAPTSLGLSLTESCGGAIELLSGPAAPLKLCFGRPTDQWLLVK